MILDRRQVPPAPPTVARCQELFAAALTKSGAQRGMSAAKKSDAEGSLFIYDAIGFDPWTGEGVTASSVASKLEEMKGIKTLHVYINSPGGSVWEGKTIYNQIARFDARKVVHVDGVASSAASLIAMAGDRIITEPGGTWLVHRVAGAAWGFSEDLRNTADEIDAETVSIRGIYERRTKKSAAEWDTWMREDRIVDAVTAKARGLTDEISEVDQARADTAAAAEEASRLAAQRPQTPAEIVASARAARAAAVAKAATLTAKFPGACPGVVPGQPGVAPTTSPGDRQKADRT